MQMQFMGNGLRSCSKWQANETAKSWSQCRTPAYDEADSWGDVAGAGGPIGVP
jgi:hypothetical protein